LAGPHGGRAAARAGLADGRPSAWACVEELTEAVGHLAPPPPNADSDAAVAAGAATANDEGLALLESLLRLPADFFFGVRAARLAPTLVALAAPRGVPHAKRAHALRQHLSPALLAAAFRRAALRPGGDRDATGRRDEAATALALCAAAGVPWARWQRAAACLEESAP